jgi:hypothetical protein
MRSFALMEILFFGLLLFEPSILSAYKCDVHNWMNGWLFVTDNPYYSITDNTGNFKLPDVPPGHVYHHRLA